MLTTDIAPPAVSTGDGDVPVRKLDSSTLRQIGHDLSSLFTTYASDRLLTEQKYMRNLRQYLGIYDPEIEAQLDAKRSRAYPRITRVKCISMLSRIMNLMFPGNERNWQIDASPSAEMKPEDVATAVRELQAERTEEGGEPPEVDEAFLDMAVNRLARKRAEKLTLLIDDQLMEIGGDQTVDWISLNRKVVESGIRYGLGVLEGPFVKIEKKVLWGTTSPGAFAAAERTIRKPMYEFLSVWDFYPDMSSKTLPGDGYFIRKVLGRSDVRKLANRPDFFGDQIKKYLVQNTNGNYMPKTFETELRTMGAAANVNTQTIQKPDGKYEIIIWKGPISAAKLMQLGVEVPEANRADDVESEIWMIDSHVIKADINAWSKMGCTVRTVHCFVFDENDTSPIGDGLPNVMRDDQMSIAAATRMTLDNASVTCGPNLEVNTQLMQAGQDITAVEAYKVWYRDDDGLTAQYPAVREIKIDSHLAELQAMVKMFMEFSDITTFVGPATGGDQQNQPSEPMRTAAGASMVRGDAALPFKDIVRNFDFFTQSVILSLVQFNRRFNPAYAQEGDYDVIARGATSLIAKEVRGMQLDVLAQTITDEERDHVDERKFIEQRFGVRDMTSLLLPEDEALRKRAARAAVASEMSDLQKQQLEAEVRKTLAEAFKNITQGQKNTASADAAEANTALNILTVGMENEEQSERADAATRK